MNVYEGPNRRAQDRREAGVAPPLDEVLNVLSKTTKAARTISDKLDRIDRTNAVNRWLLILTLVTALAAGIGAWYGYTQRQAIAECTTEGPNEPTKANDFKTGHDCFDEATQRGAKLVRGLNDTDGDGTADHVELLENQPGGNKDYSKTGGNK